MVSSSREPRRVAPKTVLPEHNTVVEVSHSKPPHVSLSLPRMHCCPQAPPRAASPYPRPTPPLTLGSAAAAALVAASPRRHSAAGAAGNPA